MRNQGFTKVRWSLPLILTFLALSIATRLFYNGEILGLDYNLHYPDGVCYTAHAYEFAGLSPEAAWQQTLTDYKGVDARYERLQEEMRPQSCQSVQARVLYPLLSAPFVSQFHLSGMLIIPILAVLLSFLFLFATLRRMRTSELSIFIGLATLATSSSLLRWNIASLPESLLLLWTSISTYVVFGFLSKKKTRTEVTLFLIAIVTLVLLSALTKRSAHFWTILFATILVIFFNKRQEIARRTLLAISAIIIIVTWIVDRSVGAILGGQNSLWIATTTTSCLKGEKVYADPGNVASAISCTDSTNSTVENLTKSVVQNVWSFVINEIGQLAVLDRSLFLLCGILIVGTLLNWKSVGPAGQIALLVALLTFGATTLNATLGLNFRLMTPALPYLIIGAVLLIDLAIKKVKVEQ